MEKLTFDTGLQSYRVNGGGVLKFNPGEPNLYARFMEAVEKLRDLETQLQQPQMEGLQAMCRLDKEMKEILGWVFGPGNDFEAIFSGVNLLAVTTSGQRVITNFLQALLPVLTQGAKRCAGQAAEEAVKKAKARRDKM